MSRTRKPALAGQAEFAPNTIDYRQVFTATTNTLKYLGIKPGVRFYVWHSGNYRQGQLVLAQVNGNVMAVHYLGVTDKGSVLLVKRAGDVVLGIIETSASLILGIPMQIAA